MTAGQALGALLAAAVGALVVFLTGGGAQRFLERWSKARAATQQRTADAAKLEARAALTDAETMAEALRDMRRRLDDCERKHEEQRERGQRQDEQLSHMQRQIDADAVLIERLAAKAEADEALIRGMRSELDDLRRVMRGSALRKVD